MGRGFAALAALTVLVVGVPVGLWALTGWPLPTSVPSVGSVTSALGDSYIPDTFLAKALAVVCWLVWFELVASVLVEAVAVARGRHAADVPLAGPVQRMAGRLVAAASLLLLIALSRPEGAPDLVGPLVVQPAAPVTQSIDLDSTDDDLGATEVAGTMTYTVGHRDTLWDIAEQHLHDPFRWTEIWELNQGRVQADGTTFSDPDLICPGWELTLPADAVGAPPVVDPTGAPTGSSDAEVMVRLDDPRPDTVLIAEQGQSGGGTEVMVRIPDDSPRPTEAP